MKRQFVQLKSFQADKSSDQPVVPNEWSPIGSSPGEASPVQYSPFAEQQGYPNPWNAGVLPSQYGAYGSATEVADISEQDTSFHQAIVEQDTTVQPAIEGPVGQSHGNAPMWSHSQLEHSPAYPASPFSGSPANGRASAFGGPATSQLRHQNPITPPESPFANNGFAAATMQAPPAPAFPSAFAPPSAPLAPDNGSMQQEGWQDRLERAKTGKPAGARQGRPPGGDGRLPTKKSRKKKRKFPIWAQVIVGVLVFLVALGGAGFAYYQIKFASTIQQIQVQKITTGKSDGNAAPQTTGDKILSGKRINILLLGSDDDGKNGNDTTPLAQTNIIVTIDPQTKYVGMLSIPRDMQVKDADSSSNLKLDEVFMYGGSGKDQAERVRNAAARQMRTIETNYNIHIDDFAWVGLDGFIKVIDVAGGVDVDAIHPMVDDVYPNDASSGGKDIFGYKRLYIAPGPQHMNGLYALEYVRTRHSDLVGDFGRTVRQQQVLTSLKTKLATPGIVAKAPDLLQALVGSLYTSLGTDEIIEIANFARTIDLNNVQKVTFGPPYSRPSGTDTNYLPNCDQMTPVIAQMFKITPNCIPQIAKPAPPSDGGGTGNGGGGNTGGKGGGGKGGKGGGGKGGGGKGGKSATGTPTITTPTVATPAVSPVVSPAVTPVNQTPAANDLSVPMGPVLSDAAQMTQNSVQVNPINGTRSLLDLMFMVVFGSIDAAQV